MSSASMKVLGFILLGALPLGLGFSGHARWEAEKMAMKRATPRESRRSQGGVP